MAENAVSTSTFPCPPGSKLDFHWGLGTEILLSEVGAASGQEQNAGCSFGTAQWLVQKSSSLSAAATMSSTQSVLQG